jgi:hypothetical protein
MSSCRRWGRNAPKFECALGARAIWARVALMAFLVSFAWQESHMRQVHESAVWNSGPNGNVQRGIGEIRDVHGSITHDFVAHTNEHYEAEFSFSCWSRGDGVFDFFHSVRPCLPLYQNIFGKQDDPKMGPLPSGCLWRLRHDTA